MAESDSILQLGIEAAREGNREEARNMFGLLTRQQPNNLQAWLWLAGVSDGPDERRAALERALEIEPTNELAIKGLQRLGVSLPVATMPPSTPLRDITDEERYAAELDSAFDDYDALPKVETPSRKTTKSAHEAADLDEVEVLPRQSTRRPKQPAQPDSDDSPPDPAALLARLWRQREQRAAEQSVSRSRTDRREDSQIPTGHAIEQRYVVGDRIFCLPYGDGVVQDSRIEGERELLTVRFPDHGDLIIDPAVSLVRKLDDFPDHGDLDLDLMAFSLDELDDVPHTPAAPVAASPQPPASEAAPLMTPFSLTDLGLTEDEIAGLASLNSVSTAPAEEPRASWKSLDADVDLQPFTLADLGHSEEDIAALGLGESVAASEETRPSAQAEAEPPMTPFSLADLGLSEEEIAALGLNEEEPAKLGLSEPSAASEETRPSVQAEDEPPMRPFSLTDLGLSDEEIAALGLSSSADAEEEMSSELGIAEEELAGLDSVDMNWGPSASAIPTLPPTPEAAATQNLSGDLFIDRLLALGHQQGYVDISDIMAGVENPEADADRIEEIGRLLHEAKIEIRDGDEIIDMDADYAKEDERLAVPEAEVTASVAPEDQDPLMTPFSLADLGPSAEQVEAAQLMTPFSLMDLGLTEDQSTDLDSADLQPFSLADLGNVPPPFQPFMSNASGQIAQPPALAAVPATSLREVVLQNIVATVHRPPLPHVLDIHITPRIASYVADLSGDQVGDRERLYQVVLSFMEQRDNSFQDSYIEGPLRLDFAAIQHQQDGAQFGAMLHRAIFHNVLLDNEERLIQQGPGHHTLLSGYRHALSQTNAETGLRIQLRINNQASELHSYRWEYLWDSENEGPLACSNRVTFARVLHTGSTPPAPPVISRKQPLRILAALASPIELDAASGSQPDELRGLAPIDLSQLTTFAMELERLALPIDPFDEDNLLASPRNYVSLERLRQALVKANEQDQRPVHIVHLICHGLTRLRDGKSCLLLHRRDSPSFDLVSDDELAQVLSQFRDTLRLVVLASCFTALPSNNQPLQGIARRLVAVGIPAVIAMQDAFEFEAAQFFAQRLYAHVALRGEIDRAVNAARREVLDQGPRKARDRSSRVSARQWAVPVLFTSLSDGRLFVVDQSASVDSDLDKTLSAIPYAQAPGSDPQRLAQGMLHGLSGQLGLQINLAIPDLTVALSKAIAEAATTATPVPASGRLFESPNLRYRREALVRAALAHVRHPARRIVLRLREKTLDDIARLVHRDRIRGLTPQTFATHIWEGGYLRLEGKQTKDILGGGPVGRVLLDEHGNPLELSWSQMRMRLRGRPVDADEQGDGYVGNLIWHRDDTLADDIFPTPLDLAVLLYAQRDVYLRFTQLTRDPARRSVGLDERTASLLLHAVYRDRYAPYAPDIAEQVLDILGLRGHERYDDGFKGYCELGNDLLADRELDFENLADVSYFLQRLAAQRVRLDADPEGDDEVDLDILTAVDLRTEEIDSRLTTDQNVIDQAVAALNAGKHIIFSGPPGTGKTTLAEDICHHAHELGFNRGHVLTTATADWTTFDTIGGYVPESGDQLVFRSGIFLDAIEANKWLIIDEINRADIDKAFGQLFTVLSGQTVVLPYKDNRGRVVRILPAGKNPSRETRDFVIHPRWRIIGTMNVYDKASLFAMSYAFMRRFAFVDVPIPNPYQYQQLLQRYFEEHKLPIDQDRVFATLCSIFERKPDNWLMHYRALGPAIAQDIVRYLHSRKRTSARSFRIDFLIEALGLYVVPQLEGLEQEQIRRVYEQLRQLFANVDVQHRKALLRQIAEMFPHVRLEDEA